MKLYMPKIIVIILLTAILLGANNKILKSELPKYNITRGEPNNKIVSSFISKGYKKTEIILE